LGGIVVGQNKQNSTSLTADLDITTMPLMNCSLSKEMTRLSTLMTSTFEQKYLSAMLSEAAPPSPAEPLTLERMRSALSELLAPLIQDVGEKLTCSPFPTFGQKDVMFPGTPIMVSPYVDEPIPGGDWSLCRSPARVKRRWEKKGYPQHVLWRRPSRSVFYIRGRVYMHTKTYHGFVKHIEEAANG
jgi:hypothetical protein